MDGFRPLVFLNTAEDFDAFLQFAREPRFVNVTL